MQKYNLSFISDNDLFNHVKETIKKYRFEMNTEIFNKNLIDPIKLTFDTKVYKRSIEKTIDLEIRRQIDKSNNNTIGYFQQNIFKYICVKNTNKSQWIVPKKGFDIVNETDKIFVEMKNKHNTMNSASSKNLFMDMEEQIKKDSESQCFLVEVIAKKSQDIAWSVGSNKESIPDERIRRVSIDKFYGLVTGEPTAFKQLVEVLPTVMDDVLNTIKLKIDQNTVHNELKEIDDNILKNIYLLSFAEYEGFDNFNI